MEPHAFHGWITRICLWLEGVLKGFSRGFKFGWVYLKGFTHKFVSKVKDLGILKGLEGAQGSCMASWGMRQGLETGINMILNIVSPRREIRIAKELFGPTRPGALHLAWEEWLGMAASAME